MPKRGTDGCRAVLPELIFVQARQSPQRILDVFARVLTRHELNPTGQNRHGFKSRQSIKLRRFIKTYTANGLRRPTCLSAFGQAKSGLKPCFYSACFFANLSVLRSFSRSLKKVAVFLFGQPKNFPNVFPRFTLRFTVKRKPTPKRRFFLFCIKSKNTELFTCGSFRCRLGGCFTLTELKTEFFRKLFKSLKKRHKECKQCRKVKAGHKIHLFTVIKMRRHYTVGITRRDKLSCLP